MQRRAAKNFLDAAFCGLKEDGLSPLTVRQDAPKVFFPSAPSGNISSRQRPDRAKISQHDTRYATIVWDKSQSKTTAALRAIIFRRVIHCDMIMVQALLYD